MDVYSKLEIGLAKVLKKTDHMSNNAKQMMDIQKMKSMPVAISNEHQRYWNNDLFARKVNDPLCNYDRSRTHLNFQISKRRKPGPIDQSRTITDKIDEAIKSRVTGRVNAQSVRAISLVFGGNREQMRQLAFGDTPIDEHGDNANVRRCYGIENWATDIYQFCCEEFGEDNIMSFIVHLDELNPHAHCVIVPITKDGRLSAKDLIGGKDINSARMRMKQLHDRLAIVNEKYGLERGEDIRETGAQHKSSETYRRELAEECQSLEQSIRHKRSALGELQRQIDLAERRIKGLQTMVTNLEAAERQKKDEIVQLEDYMVNHLDEGVREKIAEQRAALADIQAKLNDKRDKLETARDQHSELLSQIRELRMRKENIETESMKLVGDYDARIRGVLSTAAADIFLTEARAIYPHLDERTRSALSSSFMMEMVSNSHNIMFCATLLFAGCVNEATNFAETHGGGGSSCDNDWGRDPNEDDRQWALRCLKQARLMARPKRKVGRTR